MKEDILLTVLGGGNVILFIKFLIERYDRKQERKEEKEDKAADQAQEAIKKKLAILEKDILRTQLLLLILLRPKEQIEILTIGEHYFKDLKGNWYMTSIFNKWIDEEAVTKPEWFNR